MTFKLEHFGYAHLRTPSLSIDKLNSFDITNPNDLYYEGLYLSSKSLFNELKNNKNIKGGDKQHLSLYKYWNRNCTRATPFGTFAGCAYLKIGEANKLIINYSDYEKWARIDMNCLYEMIKNIEKISRIGDSLKYYPNNTFYSVGNFFRYIQYSVENNERLHELISLQHSFILEELISYAGLGQTKTNLITTLVSIAKVDTDLAQDYIDQLIASQILISELEPALTGHNSLMELITKLETLNNNSIKDIILELREIYRLFENYNDIPLAYVEVENTIRKSSLCSTTQHCIQVDLFYKGNYSISENIITKITTQVSDLDFLARKIVINDLEVFKQKFIEKYEEQLVPLCIALDAEIGIGYAGVDNHAVGNGDVISDINYRVGTSYEWEENIRSLVLKKYYDFISTDAQIIELTEDDLSKYRSNSHRFPKTMYIIGNILGKSNDLHESTFQFNLTGLSGPSSSNLLSRFTVNDTQLLESVLESIEYEDTDDECVHAEIVHTPDAKMSNIITRPVLRKYEIPYLSKSGINTTCQISINDLFVTVRNNEVVLVSKKLHKRVVPKLTSAHNFSNNSLPAYKFLCDLQFQGHSRLSNWDWGDLLQQKHLPRVVYKNIILQRAMWTIDTKLFSLGHDKNDVISKIASYYQLPKKVTYAQGDNELVIDFESNSGNELFFSLLKKNKYLVLEEFIHERSNCIVYNKTNNEKFINEVVIPVKNVLSVPSTNFKFSTKAFTDRTKRKFVIGDEWLYYKIYSGTKEADNLLTTYVLPLVQNLIDTQLVEKFFYVRYYDEQPHLRIRFFNSIDKKKLNIVSERLIAILNPLLQSGLIDKIVADTYNRELERYGFDLIPYSESIFFNDSLATINALKYFSVLKDNSDNKLLFALQTTDSLLNDFGYNLETKHTLISQLHKSFFKEFNGTTDLTRKLNAKYRKYQKQIFSDNDKLKNSETYIILKNRSKANLPITKRLISEIGDDIKIDDLVASHIHMSINRIFQSKQRQYEFLIYHFLERYYSSTKAIDEQRH